MTKTQIYDLEDRTLKFCKRVICLIKKLDMTIENAEIGKQLIRSAGSVGANYIEANESLGKKDFRMHIKISRKEAKKSVDGGVHGIYQNIFCNTKKTLNKL
ncbi:MAG: four helix bundle protein [Patescibacteria group bacterium]|nr:four helix bundle protein [Patescibacteria group bacterium]